MLSRARRRMRDDRGIVVPLVALSLVVLFAFTAVAVDVGLVYNQRRQDQGAVDTGILAGAYEAFTDQEAVVDQVIRTSLAGVHYEDSLTDWEDAFLGCTDPKAATAGFTQPLVAPKPSTPLGADQTWNCINFSGSGIGLRVRLPDTEVPSAFLGVLGLDPFTSSAFAEIGIQGARIPPFILFSTSSPGGEYCLRASSAGDPPPPLLGNGPGNAPTPGTTASDPDPCDGTNAPTQGAFGTLRPHEYTGCNDGPGNQTILRAIARGTDHDIGTYTAFGDPPYTVPTTHADRISAYGDVRTEGGNSCGTVLPNTFPLDTGYTSNTLRCGFLSLKNSSDCEGAVPRLQSSSSNQATYKMVNEEMENQALWDFMPSAVYASVPAACSTLQANRNAPSYDYYDKKALLETCMKDWSAVADLGTAQDQLFTDDLGDSARYTLIPVVAESKLADAIKITGTNYVHFNYLAPVFFQGLYSKGGGNTNPCDPADSRTKTGWMVHQAGQTFSCGGNNDGVDRVSAFRLDCRMVSDDVCISSASEPSTTGDSASKEVNLTR